MALEIPLADLKRDYGQIQPEIDAALERVLRRGERFSEHIGALGAVPGHVVAPDRVMVGDRAAGGEIDPKAGAALDLADSGYFVYLVEKTGAIGGAMPQYNKVFPTNDCSMCIIAPKLVECGRHPNIQIRVFNAWEQRAIVGRVFDMAADFGRLNRRMPDQPYNLAMVTLDADRINRNGPRIVDEIAVMCEAIDRAR